MKVENKSLLFRGPGLLFCSALLLTTLFSCRSTNESAGAQEAPPTIPVITLTQSSATTTKDYTGTLEGKVNVEIRPQVDGYLDKVYVDEGAFVQAGELLFKINDQPYTQQFNNAVAVMHAAEAALSNTQLEVDKVIPLVKSNVVSIIQLKTVQAAHHVAKANLEQAKAAVESAKINLGFTKIKAPVSGFIGRIPRRLGSLVGKTDQQPLTTLSDVHEIYAYFSIGENDFINFKAQFPGKTLTEKIRQIPPVSLLLADNTIYTHKGRISMVDGQFDKNTGSIMLRATFPNADGLLRAGNTGKIRIDQLHINSLLVPQASTLELQNKVFVYKLADSNKLSRVMIDIDGKSGTDYIIKAGLKPGDKIVSVGLDRLHEGMVINPGSSSASAKAGK
ncbi:efflux RND transporter periplasmic adaptor subunit [Pedobacter sp. WC2423]|uniref:efflux RND transporter periplasmic adaptor subunit n=1 Tax=Pedobacter sp. WC2423 TaxID=3234142 RepID=UPI0034673057